MRSIFTTLFILLVTGPAFAKDIYDSSPIFDDIVFVGKTLNGDVETLSEYADLIKIDYTTFAMISTHWQKLALSHCEVKYLPDIQLIIDNKGREYFDENGDDLWPALHEKYAYCRREYLNQHWDEIRTSIRANYKRLK